MAMLISKVGWVWRCCFSPPFRDSQILHSDLTQRHAAFLLPHPFFTCSKKQTEFKFFSLKKFYHISKCPHALLPQWLDGVQLRAAQLLHSGTKISSWFESLGLTYSNLITHSSNCADQRNTFLPSYPQGLESHTYYLVCEKSGVNGMKWNKNRVITITRKHKFQKSLEKNM